MDVDILIRNAKVYNTFTQDFEDKNVYILNGYFFHIGKEISDEIIAKNEIDAKGKYMIPGLIDIHMHIESSMTIPQNFSEAVLPHGVTTVVADPHEIANVFGVEGIEAFMSNDTILDIFYGIPSSVPSTSFSLETTGGKIGMYEVEKLLDNPKIVCLGEVMNFNDIVMNDNTLINNIIKLCKHKRPTMPIEGHCPKITGLDLSRFLFKGIDADHTQQDPESIYEKITNGVFLEIQGKSLTKENIEVLVNNNFYEYFALVTDDIMPDHLIEGHLNKIVEKAVSLGLPLEKAIYVSTYTPARRMGFQDRGVIAPGKIGDFIILDDINNFKIKQVFKKGQCIYNNGVRLFEENAPIQFPNHFYSSINSKKITVEDLDIKVNHVGEALVNVIRIQELGTFTFREKRKIKISDGLLNWEDSGLALIIVIQRYGKNHNMAYGFVENAISNKGAIGTTWAHDHHNIMIMGTSKEDIILVHQQLLKINGGYVVASNNKIVADVALEVGGIVSCMPLEELSSKIKNIRYAMKSLGYNNINEIMSFSTLSLPVSPEIKITDVGILDTRTQEIIPLIEELI